MTQPPSPVPTRPYAPAGGYSVPSQAPHPYPYGYVPGYAPPVPTAPGGAPLAEFWERLVAYLLDRLIIIAVLLIPVGIGAFILFRRLFDQMNVAAQTNTEPDLTGFLLGYLLFIACASALQLLATFCYEVLYQSRTGQTVGKRVMKIRVERVDGEPLTVAAALRRWLVQDPVALVVPFFGWLDGLWQLWDKPFRQCLHDKVAKTVVVKANAGARAAAS